MTYDYITHSRLWYLKFIAILSFVCPKLACIELLISLHNDRHLFADGFVTVRPIATKFGRDKESVSNLKFREFYLNPSNFNRKLTMMFKLDLKKNDAYRILNPSAERVNIKRQYILHRKCTLACILCTHKKSYKLDDGIMLIFVFEKNRPLLLAKGVDIHVHVHVHAHAHAQAHAHAHTHTHTYVKCEMKLLIHSRTSTASKFGNG